MKQFLVTYLSARSNWEAFTWHRHNKSGLEQAIRKKIHNYHSRGFPKVFA